MGLFWKENSPKGLGPSKKMDLDLWDCFGRKVILSCNQRYTIMCALWTETCQAAPVFSNFQPDEITWHYITVCVSTRPDAAKLPVRRPDRGRGGYSVQVSCCSL